MGLMKRREFLVGVTLASTAAPQSGIQVEVMEAFSSGSGPSALLVHHADEATREAFSNWMRNNSGRRVAFGLRNGAEVVGRIFRVRLCFGRGLILLNAPAVGIRANDILKLK
jgi:hypothetical protein